MTSQLYELTSSIRMVDLFDVAVVAIVLYALITWLRQRASRAVVVIAVLMLCLYLTARWLQLTLTLTFFQIGFTAIAVGLILIFQNDLRWAVERLASWSFVGSRETSPKSADTVDIILEAVSALSSRSVGALIIFKGRQPLERHLRGGVPLTGQLSLPLLLSIFDPESPGHDGAVVIDQGSLERFAVHLPLSENLDEVGKHGTRHAAALGLSEQCDALIVAVSEESGDISLAAEGVLHERIAGAPLRKRLSQQTAAELHPSVDSITNRLLKRDFGMKLAALAVACLLWIGFGYRRNLVQRSFVVPIAYRNLPENHMLLGPRSTEVQVVISAPQTSVDLMQPGELVASVDVRPLGKGRHQITINRENLSLPTGASLVNVSPQQISLEIDRTVAAELPIRVLTRGRLPSGLRLQSITVEPDKVVVDVPQSQRADLSQIDTEWVDLSEITGTEFREVSLLLPRNCQFPGGRKVTVRVHVKVARPAESEDAATTMRFPGNRRDRAALPGIRRCQGHRTIGVYSETRTCATRRDPDFLSNAKEKSRHALASLVRSS